METVRVHINAVDVLNAGPKKEFIENQVAGTTGNYTLVVDLDGMTIGALQRNMAVVLRFATSFTDKPEPETCTILNPPGSFQSMLEILCAAIPDVARYKRKIVVMPSSKRPVLDTADEFVFR